MALPDRNNVYGSLQCQGQLNKVAEVVTSALSLLKSEIDINTSGFDGSKKLLVRTVNAEFDAYFTGAHGELLFNGTVAGSVEEVTELVQKVHGALHTAGFIPRFEIYDDAKNCVAEFNAAPSVKQDFAPASRHLIQCLLKLKAELQAASNDQAKTNHEYSQYLGACALDIENICNRLNASPESRGSVSGYGSIFRRIDDGGLSNDYPSLTLAFLEAERTLENWLANRALEL